MQIRLSTDKFSCEASYIMLVPTAIEHRNEHLIDLDIRRIYTTKCVV